MFATLFDSSLLSRLRFTSFSLDELCYSLSSASNNAPLLQHIVRCLFKRSFRDVGRLFKCGVEVFFSDLAVFIASFPHCFVILVYCPL